MILTAWWGQVSWVKERAVRVRLAAAQNVRESVRVGRFMVRFRGSFLLFALSTPRSCRDGFAIGAGCAVFVLDTSVRGTCGMLKR